MTHPDLCLLLCIQGMKRDGGRKGTGGISDVFWKLRFRCGVMFVCVCVYVYPGDAVASR